MFKNSIEIKADSIFSSLNALPGLHCTTNDLSPSCFNGPAPALTLVPGSNAIDAGVFILGINEVFNGNAPDLGAHESGAPPPSYGPR